MSASSAPTDITPASIWHRPKISDEILAPRYGYPLKLRIPTKLGFKNPKWITAIFVTNRFPADWPLRGSSRERRDETAWLGI